MGRGIHLELQSAKLGTKYSISLKLHTNFEQTIEIKKIFIWTGSYLTKVIDLI
jgi:hypothetical protein